MRSFRVLLATIAVASFPASTAQTEPESLAHVFETVLTKSPDWTASEILGTILGPAQLSNVTRLIPGVACSPESPELHDPISCLHIPKWTDIELLKRAEKQLASICAENEPRLQAMQLILRALVHSGLSTLLGMPVITCLDALSPQQGRANCQLAESCFRRLIPVSNLTEPETELKAALQKLKLIKRSELTDSELIDESRSNDSELPESDQEGGAALDLNNANTNLIPDTPMKRIVANPLISSMVLGSLLKGVLRALGGGFLFLSVVAPVTIALALVLINFANQLNQARVEKMQLTVWNADPIEMTFAQAWVNGTLSEYFSGDDESVPAPAPPQCDVFVYWSRHCHALGSAKGRNCSEGGTLVEPRSCITHFSGGSRTCGFQGFGCRSLCYNANLDCDETSSDKWNYQSVDCGTFESREFHTTQADHYWLKVASFSKCRETCFRFRESNTNVSCHAFAFQAARWGRSASTCVIYHQAQPLPAFKPSDEATGCVLAQIV